MRAAQPLNASMRHYARHHRIEKLCPRFRSLMRMVSFITQPGLIRRILDQWLRLLTPSLPRMFRR